ncbi:hypothetical protein B551_0223265 [Cupriavidus sp. HPC(L)]|uniref:hypothetical protein n=1 Tax=Cupriavidus sp. HPC(L) TaxID=1217418 RepID=UPI0003BEA7C5|nr:hypothetical protein [Cupriavidus sp. HPC(L)]ESH89100.1 hypothetical protein B551_0223265 [Cupriavidus sp. HPC(L)]
MNRGRTARIALRALAAVVAGTLAACGGDDDGGGGQAGNGNTGGNNGTPTAPATYSLTVQPHLGTVLHGLVTVGGLDGKGVIASGTIGDVGQITLTIPAANCGPGLITVSGGPSAVFFDEATGKQQALSAADKVRALVPDICKVEGTKPVSMLDELLLHLPSPVVGSLRANQEAIQRANEAEAARLKQEMTAAIDQLKQELEAEIAKALLLPADYARVVPTPISQPLSGNSALPSDTRGVVAATLHALRERQYAAAPGLSPMSDNSFENFAVWAARAIRESQASRTAAGISDWTQAYVAQAVAQGIDLLAAQGAMDIRAVANRATVLMQAHMTSPPDPTARARESASQAPVDSEDLTATMRAAALPLLLRAETPARLDEARTRGSVTYPCAAGERTQGEVTIAYEDATPNGVLDHGDIFTLDYRQCLTREPLSGLVLARSGRMTVTYFAGEPGVFGASGQVQFDIALSRPDPTKATDAQPLLQAAGMWTDWLAFGDPLSASGPLLAGTTPLVRIDSQYFMMTPPGSATAMTQGMQVRLDASSDFGSGSVTGSGRAALKLRGMSMAVEIDTPQPLVIEDAAAGQRAVSGSVSLTRHTPVARQGALSADQSGLIRVALPGTDGAETVRLMSMPRLMAHYLAL